MKGWISLHAGAVVIAAALCVATGCGPSSGSGARQSAKGDDSAATTDQTDTASAGTKPTPKPDGGNLGSAGSVNASRGDAALIVGSARSSVQQVVLLHDVSVSIAHPNGLPGDTTAGQAARLVQFFTDQHTLLVDLTTRSAAPAARKLRDALGDYATLAKIVKATATTSSTALPASFTPKIEAADRVWKSAVTQIGDAAHLDLLVNLPPLLVPDDPSSAVPPPPK